MAKSNFSNKLNNQNGLTSGEVIIALLIILSTLGVIGMIYTNLISNSKGVERKTGATRIATNIIENISQKNFDDIETELQGKLSEGSISYENGKYTINSASSIFNTTVPKGYTAEISINNIENKNVVKEVVVTVKYRLNKKDKSVELKKVIARDYVRECNSPNFGSEYLGQLGCNEDDEFSYSNPNTGNKIICPVKYNGQEYEIITDKNEVNSIWYSYSNKQWARVLVLDNNEFEEARNDSSKIKDFLKSDKSYVWVPRFGVESGSDVNCKFKYKDTDFAILNSFYDTENTTGLIYNYIENIDFSQSFVFETGKTGKWCRCSDLETIGSEAYYLNKSNYGPMIEY